MKICRTSALRLILLLQRKKSRRCQSLIWKVKEREGERGEEKVEKERGSESKEGEEGERERAVYVIVFRF
jgi:hypothetical protein